MKIRKIRSKMAVAAMAVAALTVGFAIPASAATYTWLNASVNPNGTTYSDTGTGAKSFSRMGVSAKIDKADGYTWQTSVSYNGYWNTGQATATQNGPRGWGTTYAKYTFLPGPGPNDRVHVSAWLLDAQLGATGNDLIPANHTDAEPPASANVTAESLRSNSAPELELTAHGVADSNEIWSGRTPDGETCLFTARNEYVGATCADAEDFTVNGLSMHNEGPDHSIQIILAPHGGITEEMAARAGLTRLSESVAVNTGAPVAGAVQIPEGAPGSSVTRIELTSASARR
jgi:hypothetical protein